MSYALWLFVDAKGGEKIGIKSRTHIIKLLNFKFSLNSKTKGENMEN